MTATPNTSTSGTSTRGDFDTTRWDAFLTEVARRHHVPGIVAGVLSLDTSTRAEQRFVASTGVTNLRTGVETDKDTVCQIGSITKVVTATIIMQLREEGALDLDTKVIDVVPEFGLASEFASEITVWNLLTHTSGIDGDLFTDTGRGEDCVAKYVDTLHNAQSLFAPSAGWSYCNSGFVVAGRIIEVLDGRSWDETVKERISKPLGLDKFLTLPEEVLAHRHQYGHVREPGQAYWNPAGTSHITRSMGAAGIITSSADDLLDFGAVFLRGGDTGAGATLLSPESIATMTSAQWTLDPAIGGSKDLTWGLGWILPDWNGRTAQGHSGTTIGNNAWFHVLPDDDVVFVVFCNGGVASLAAQEIHAAFAREFLGTGLTPEPGPSGPASQTKLDDAWLGTYSDASTTLTVTQSETGTYAVTIGQVNLDRETDGTNEEDETDQKPAGAGPWELLPADAPGKFLTRADSLGPWIPVSFTKVGSAPVAYVGIRCLPQAD